MSQTDELAKLSELHRAGELTDEEFASAKQALILSDDHGHRETKAFFRFRKSRLVVLFGLLLVGAPYYFFVVKAVNTNEPAYMKDVTAYKEGDGIVAYFILADANGAMTTAEGDAHIKVTQTSSHSGYSEQEETLFETTSHIYPRDYQSTKVGLGAFEHDALLCSLGRIPIPSASSNSDGKVSLEFTPSGKKDALKGEATFLY